MELKMQNGEYYSFTNQLKEKIKETLGELLQRLDVYLKENKKVGPNFDVYIYENNPKVKYKKQHYFIIEVDDCTFLDIIADYDPENNSITNSRFLTTLKRHNNWVLHYFDKVKLPEETIKLFLQKEEELINFVEKNDWYFSITIDEFNPEVDYIPESVAELNHIEIKELYEVKDYKKMISVLEKYYQYNFEMIEIFNRYIPEK